MTQVGGHKFYLFQLLASLQIPSGRNYVPLVLGLQTFADRAAEKTRCPGDQKLPAHDSNPKQYYPLRVTGSCAGEQNILSLPDQLSLAREMKSNG
jgi:hypothetical protein